MAEFCENCGGKMKRWDATHCSEECLLESIRNSTSFHNKDSIVEIMKKMRDRKCYDRKLLEQLK